MALKIVEMIDEIESFIENDCKKTLMDRDKILVDKNTILELLEDLRDSVPNEVATYQKVINNKQAILNNAKFEAEDIIKNANRIAEKSTDEHEIMQRAYDSADKLIDDANNRAKDIIDKATIEANNMISSAVNYTDNLLGILETIIKDSIDTSSSSFNRYLDSLKNNLETVNNNRYELSKSIKTEEME